MTNSREVALQLASHIEDVDLKRRVEKSLAQGATLPFMVETFHRMYGMPVVDPSKAQLDFSHIERSRLAMRFNLVAEEFLELLEAMDIRGVIKYQYLNEDEEWVDADDIVDAIENTEERNMVEVADACADLKYVIQGFELEIGIPSQAVLEEVQASNMSKLGKDGKPIYRADGKVLKGPYYFKPNVRQALSAWGMRLGPAPKIPSQAS